MVLGLLGVLNRSPTLLLDVCRALCADSAGNFKNPNCIAQGSIAKTVRDFSTDEAVATDGLSTSDSDGVVNTLSMLDCRSLSGTIETDSGRRAAYASTPGPLTHSPGRTRLAQSSTGSMRKSSAGRQPFSPRMKC